MSTPNLHDFFQSAQNEDLLSNTSFQALNIIDIGAQIQAGLGIAIDDVTATWVSAASGFLPPAMVIRKFSKPSSYSPSRPCVSARVQQPSASQA